MTFVVGLVWGLFLGILFSRWWLKRMLQQQGQEAVVKILAAPLL